MCKKKYSVKFRGRGDSHLQRLATGVIHVAGKSTAHSHALNTIGRPVLNFCLNIILRVCFPQNIPSSVKVIIEFNKIYPTLYNIIYEFGPKNKIGEKTLLTRTADKIVIIDVFTMTLCNTKTRHQRILRTS